MYFYSGFSTHKKSTAQEYTKKLLCFYLKRIIMISLANPAESPLLLLVGAVDAGTSLADGY